MVKEFRVQEMMDGWLKGFALLVLAGKQDGNYDGLDPRGLFDESGH